MKAPRKIPLEIKYAGREGIAYGAAAEELGGRGGRGAAVVLPFSANGARRPLSAPFPPPFRPLSAPFPPHSSCACA